MRAVLQTTGQIVTKEYLDACQPKSLKRLYPLDDPPPKNFVSYQFEKLSKSYSNPRAILRLYRNYTRTTDYPCYPWLVRAACQIGNSFGPNSYWSPRDKQTLTSTKLFKSLIFDLVERSRFLHPRHAPRLIYALSSLEYRSRHLLPHLLQIVLDNLQHWRLSVLATLAHCLTLLGIGDESNNAFESKDYSGLIQLLLTEVFSREESDASPFDWASLAYTCLINNLYEWPTRQQPAMPTFLSQAVKNITLKNLPESGWLQYIIYLILYCADVEKPHCEVEIKKSIPFEIQEFLHNRWLTDILIKAQPQGSELLQSDVDLIFGGLGLTQSLLNCSVGRDEDEQHCLFTGHLFPERRLCFEYDYLQPIDENKPKISGLIKFRRRMFNAMGYNVCIIHKCFWDNLTTDEKESQILSILDNFKPSSEEVKNEPVKNIFTDTPRVRHLKHLKPRFEVWPPEKIVV